MIAKSELPTDTSDREVVQTRVFDAPRALVYQAFTDRAQIDQWFGPKGYRNETFAMDVRPGGQWRFMMHGPDGTDHTNRVVYLEVTPGERLVYDHGSDVDDDPDTFRVTVTFAEQDGKTTLTMRSRFRSAAALEAVKKFGAVELGKQTLDRLAQHLPTMEPAGDELVITRVLVAPRELVFKAWTEADRLACWWGPKGSNIVVNKLDVRPGGLFHYSMTTPTGELWWGKFAYREIVRPERLVYVSSFSDAAGNVTRAPFPGDFPLEILNNLTFSEQDGRTLVTLRGGPVNATEAERKFFQSMRTSMQGGFAGTFDQLDAYLTQG